MPIRLHIDSSAALSILSGGGLGKAYRDLASVAPGRGSQQRVVGGEDPFRNELIRLGHEAPREREIREVDEARGLRLLVTRLGRCREVEEE